MINIAICDDEPAICRVYTLQIEKLFRSMSVEIKVKSYSNGVELLMEHKLCPYELVFLDIDMPGMSGFEVAESIRKIDSDTVIIFVTNEEQLVFESFHYNPFRFVRKPYFYMEIGEVISSFFVLYRRKNHTHVWKCLGGQQVTLKDRDIYYIESNKHKVTIYSKVMNITVMGKISDLEIELREYGFVRAHVGYLVNMEYIFTINKSDIILTGQQCIPLSRHRAEDVKTVYQNYLRGW